MDSTHRESEKKYQEQIRWEQWQAQVAALSCEVTLNAIRKGLRNTIVHLRGKPKTKYEYNQERKRDVRRMKAVTKVKTKYQMMYEVEEEPSGPAYKTLDVDPSLFTRHYQQASFKQSLKVIHPSFDNYKLLERIDVSHQLIGDSGIETLCSAIRGSAVKVLNVAGNHITDVGIRHIASILRSLHHLYSLNISRNTFGDQGISLLSDRKLYHSGTVSQYDFTFNNLSPLSGHHLGNLFLGDSQGFCPITHIRFGGNLSHRSTLWGDDFLKQFLSPVIKSSNVVNLKSLYLTDCSLSDIGIECIAGLLLCDQCGIEELYLSKCFFTPRMKDLLTKTFLLTRRRFQLFAQDCGITVQEIKYWQEDLINASPEQKHRLQRNILRYETSLHCAAITQQALLSCHVAQYYLRQQMLNSWNIETPIRWQVNPMIGDKREHIYDLADETGVKIETNMLDSSATPGSSGVLRKQASIIQRQGSLKVNVNQTGASSSTSLRLPTILSKEKSFISAVTEQSQQMQTLQQRQQQQQIVLTNATSAKVHNTFNTATFVDAELLRQVTVQRDPLCRKLAQNLADLMEQACFVHFLQEVLAFMASQSTNQQEIPHVEQIPQLAQSARKDLVDINKSLLDLETLHLLRLARWTAAVDAIVLQGKDFLRRVEQEQNEAFAMSDKSKNRSEKTSSPSNITNSLISPPQSSSAIGKRNFDQSNNSRESTMDSRVMKNSSPTMQPFSRSRHGQKASVRLVKIQNDVQMESLYMMQEDAWSQTIEQDRVDTTIIGLKYHFRLLHFALIQMTSAVIFQQQQQQQSARTLYGRSKKNSTQSLMSLTLGHSQEGQNASNPSLKSLSASPNKNAGSLFPLISSVHLLSGEPLASSRSEVSMASSSSNNKKLQRQAIAAERAQQQQMQAILKEGQEYHRNLVRNAVPCAYTLGTLGFYLYYLHTVYGKEVETSAK